MPELTHVSLHFSNNLKKRAGLYGAAMKFHKMFKPSIKKIYNLFILAQKSCITRSKYVIIGKTRKFSFS